MTVRTKEPITIVFVDDETHALTIFKHTFKEEIKSNRINLLTFENGEDCLEHLTNNSIELNVIFSDIKMPKIDGFDLYSQIKKLHPDVDMFFISAYDLEDYKQKADLLGAKGYLIKPVNFKAIKSIVRDYVEI